MIKPFIYVGDRHNLFLKDYEEQKGEKQKIVFDLEEVGDEKAFYSYFKKKLNIDKDAYMDKDVIGDYLYDYSYDGICMYFEIKNLKKTKLEVSCVQAFVDYTISSCYESARMRSVFHGVYFDYLPESRVIDDGFSEYLVV